MRQKRDGHEDADHGVKGPGLPGKALVAWTRVCLRHPFAVLALAVLSAVTSGYWSAQHLGYKVSRSDLVDPQSEYSKLWIDCIREFGEDDDAAVENGNAGTVSRRSKMAAHNRAVLCEGTIGATAPITPPFQSEAQECTATWRF